MKTMMMAIITPAKVAEDIPAAGAAKLWVWGKLTTPGEFGGHVGAVTGTSTPM